MQKCKTDCVWIEFVQNDKLVKRRLYDEKIS